MAASKPAEHVIQVDAGVVSYRDVDLMDNIYLCHRPMARGMEYAVVEHYFAHGTNEIWNRGWDAVQVLKTFANEQRQALEFGTEDMMTHITEFLAETYSGQNLSYLSNRFRHIFNEATSSRHTSHTNKITVLPQSRRRNQAP
jgi:hypothetical protein